MNNRLIFLFNLKYDRLWIVAIFLQVYTMSSNIKFTYIFVAKLGKGSVYLVRHCFSLLDLSA